jgi:hypothetical protein
MINKVTDVNSLKSRQMRFRLILPIVYLFIAGILFLGCFQRLGHSPWCARFLDSMFPAQWLGVRLMYSLVARGTISQTSDTWRILNELMVPTSFILTIAQYYLLGLIVDRLKNRSSR